MSVEFRVRFGVVHEIGALVVRVPAQVLGLCEAVCMGKSDLRSELDLLARLSPDDGPYVRLRDTHDHVVQLVGLVGVHFPLLVVDGAHHPKTSHRPVRQGVFPQQVQGTLTQFMGLRKINTIGLGQANKVMHLSAIPYNLKKYLKFVQKPSKTERECLLWQCC